jgi:hypothetical protein
MQSRFKGIPKALSLQEKSTAKPKRVQFSIVRIEQETTPANDSCFLSLEDRKEVLWWSRTELRDFNAQAKREAMLVKQDCPSYFGDFERLFQECCSKSCNLQDLLGTPSAQRILQTENRSAFQRMRGLESHSLGVMSHYRKFHAQTLLKVQDNCFCQKNTTNYGRLEQWLRKRSMHTSRPSKALARLLANSDFNDVASMIRQELEER